MRRSRFDRLSSKGKTSGEDVCFSGREDRGMPFP